MKNYEECANYVRIEPPFVNLGEWYDYEGMIVKPIEFSRQTGEIWCEIKAGHRFLVNDITKFREIPQSEPSWKVGDWAFHKNAGIVIIEQLNPPIDCWVKNMDGEKYVVTRSQLRPLTLTDWARVINDYARGNTNIRNREER